MAAIKCPRCNDEVRIPAEASGEATVACPLCNEEFPLGDVLAQLPPLLVVVHDPQAVADIPTSVVDSPADTASPADRPVSFSLGESSTATAPGVKSSVVPSPRSRRKQVNVGVELVKIVLGGIAGLLIAQMVLWWGIKTDPIPAVSKLVGAYLPAVVPPQFRPATSDPSVDAGSGQSSSESTTGAASVAEQPPSPSGFSFPQPGEGSGPANTPLEQTTDGADSLDSGEVAESQVEPPKPEDPLEIPDVTLDPLEGLQPPVTPTAPTDPPADEPAEPDTDQQPDSKDATDGSPAVPEGAAKTSNAADLIKAIRRTIDANLQWDTADELSNVHRRDLYSGLVGIGRAVADREPDQEQSQTLRQLLLQISALPEKQSMIASIGTKWLDYDNRTSNGIALIGVVRQWRDIGPLRGLDLETSEGRQVLVVTTTSSQDRCQPNSRILVLGKIIDDPRSNLNGFQGSQSQLVISGLTIDLSHLPE